MNLLLAILRFFYSLQELFGICFEENVSDKFFAQLQWNVDNQMRQLEECMIDAKSFRRRCFINWTIFSLEVLRFIKKG